MNYGEIKNCDIANGVGVRVSLFVSGCRHHCEGCFNPQTWGFTYGKPFTQETINYILDLLRPDYIQGFSLLGGEPFEPENQKELAPFLQKIVKTYPDKDIWCYSGYLFDADMIPGGKIYTEYTKPMLDCIDVLVDGEFVLEKKDITLKFCGSSNQRVIDVKKSVPGDIVLVD